MSKVRTALTGISASTALVVGSLFLTPAAHAAPTSSPTTSDVSSPSSEALQEFTPEQISQAIDEAKASGYVEKETSNTDGSVTITLDLGHGFKFDLVQGAPSARLGAGKDGKGTYVSFNGTDQNMIISGATYAIGVALCAVSAGTFCIVAGAIITAATVAITSNGGVRCSGGKSLRVYPFAGGKVKPRCA